MELIWIIIAIVIFFNVLVPVFVLWAVIRYVFSLRQQQNEYFLEDLYKVVRCATYDALMAKENANKQSKISHHTYNTNKKR